MASPAAELIIDEPLVRSLLAEQQPSLADLPIRIIGNGWDNVVVQLGADLSVRLPRREAAAQLVLNEQRWLPGDRVPASASRPDANLRRATQCSVSMVVEHLRMAAWRGHLHHTAR